MSNSTDWLPHTRDGQLAMAKDWLPVMTANAEAWGIPPAVITDFTALTGAADTALAAAKNETTRTPVVTARCREAFEALTDKMRDIKRRYFLSPPLTEADLAALGLKKHDPTQTPSGEPASQVTIETFLVGRHELGIKMVYVTGSPNDPANKGFRIWYSVIAPGETPPSEPEELRKSFYTTRKKDVWQKAYGFLPRSLRFTANSMQLLSGVLLRKTPKLSGVAG